MEILLVCVRKYEQNTLSQDQQITTSIYTQKYYTK